MCGILNSRCISRVYKEHECHVLKFKGIQFPLNTVEVCSEAYNRWWCHCSADILCVPVAWWSHSPSGPHHIQDCRTHDKRCPGPLQGENRVLISQNNNFGISRINRVVYRVNFFYLARAGVDAY